MSALVLHAIVKIRGKLRLLVYVLSDKPRKRGFASPPLGLLSLQPDCPATFSRSRADPIWPCSVPISVSHARILSVSPAICVFKASNELVSMEAIWLSSSSYWCAGGGKARFRGGKLVNRGYLSQHARKDLNPLLEGAFGLQK